MIVSERIVVLFKKEKKMQKDMCFFQMGTLLPKKLRFVSCVCFKFLCFCDSEFSIRHTSGAFGFNRKSLTQKNKRTLMEKIDVVVSETKCVSYHVRTQVTYAQHTQEPTVCTVLKFLHGTYSMCSTEVPACVHFLIN